jgi:hypothetical protein
MQKTLSWIVSTTAAVLLGAVGSAHAQRKVYLNGIDLADVEVTNQSFQSCAVKFDANGAVHITAKGFDIAKQPTAGGEAKPVERKVVTPLTKRYFLVSKQNRLGATQYDVDVIINRRHVATIRSRRDPAIVEITRYLVGGANRVHLIANKNLGKTGKRRSYSPEDAMEILMGEGSVADGTVTLRSTPIHYRRDASETERFTDHFELTTR